MAMAARAGVVLLVVLAVAQAVRVAGKEYEVKWDFPNGDHQFFSAVQGKTLYVGDTLTFNYAVGMHNVVEVGSVEDFNECTMKNPVGKEHDDGMSSITLDKAGPQYFICSYIGHCAGGMKIKVLVKNHDHKL